MKTSKAFSTYAWIFLAYLILVILFGAWVRITHSGAGCGSHWPTCHGDLIPFEPSTETIIEYTHRLTSGFLGILGLVLIGWAWRCFGRGPIFWATIVTFVFILFEGAIGAGLVLAELVKDNDSVARAVIIAIHLANTLSLTAAAGFAAWWSMGKPVPQNVKGSPLLWLLMAGLAGIVATSMSGAVTALGDTLFPVDPTLGEGLITRLRDDLSAVNHFLVRLRIIHPIVAIITAFYLLAMTWVVRLRESSGAAESWATITATIVIAQLGLGFLNIALAAPGWLQLAHLLFAQLVWLSTLFLTATVISERSALGLAGPDHGEQV